MVVTKKAYYDTARFGAVKSFIVQAPGVLEINYRPRVVIRRIIR